MARKGLDATPLGGCYAPALFMPSIRPSAWKGSRNFALRGFAEVL